MPSQHHHGFRLATLASWTTVCVIVAACGGGSKGSGEVVDKASLTSPNSLNPQVAGTAQQGNEDGSPSGQAPAPAPGPDNSTGPVSGSVQARLAANRVSGPAPLAVHFDATGTSISSSNGAHPFHHVRYEFDFGDPRGQTWAISGLSKNTQTGGPIAAHVFDNPGIYTVRVRARDGSGGVSETSLSITVQDPSSVYAGTRTVCVSTSGYFADCPAGAAQQTVLPDSASYSGRRVLLRRGESFGTINIPHGASHVQIGAFGSGSTKPTVSRVSIGTLNPSSSAFPHDITVSDLSISGGIEQYVTASRLLFYRNDIGSQGSGLVAQINLASALGYIVQHHWLPRDQYYQPREIFVVENRVHGSTSNPIVNMVGEGSRFVIMGNDMGTAQQHTVRIYAMHKGFIAHNALRGRSSDGIRVALKLHSGGLGEYDDNYAISGNSWATRQVVIANNRLGDTTDNNSFTGGASPENNTSESRQGLEDVVLENNLFYRGPNTNTEFILMGRRMTTRGNTRADGGTPNINQYGNSYQLLPSSWNGPYYVQ